MSHNLLGRSTATLDKFSGTITLSEPVDLTEGASPRCQNVDFNIGSVFTRQGLTNPFTYSGNSVGPSPATVASSHSLGNVPWNNPNNILLDDGSYTTCLLASSSSSTSSTSVGSSVGGGAAWSNPTNIDSNSSYANVALSSGGGGSTTYSSASQSASVNFYASSTNTSPPPAYSSALAGLPSVAATSATLNVDVSGSISVFSGGGVASLEYSVNGGSSWTSAYGWSTSFSQSVSIPISGFSNISSIQIRFVASGGCSPSGSVTINASINSWNVVVTTGGGGGSLTSETLQAAVSSLSVPSNAVITGVEVSFTAYKTGATPTFSLGMNVGSEVDSFTLTGSPATYTSGSSSDLWGYSGWDNTTLSSLLFYFNASASSTSGIFVNNLVVTVYYSSTLSDSDALDIKQFGFSVPSTYMAQGITVTVTGYCDAAGTLSVQMLKAGTPVGNIETLPLNVGSPTLLTFGGINDLFGTSWLYSDFNNTSFGVRITASSSSGAEIFLDYATIGATFITSSTNFNHVSTYEDDYQNIYTTALDAAGTVYQENVTANIGVLTPLFTGVPSNNFAVDFTIDSRQYLAFSDLNQGDYPPTQIIGDAAGISGWQDRVSQVGPGSAPTFQGTLQASSVANITAYSTANSVVTLTANNSFTAGEVVTINIASGPTFLNTSPGPVYNVLGTGLSSTQFEVAYPLASGSGAATGNAVPQYTYPIAASPNGITQFPFWNSAQGYQSQLDDILWSAGPGSTTAGTVITVYYLNAYTHQTGIDQNLVNAFNSKKFPTYVYISGTNQPLANGTQLVTGIGIGTPPGGGDQRYYFTFNVASSGYKNLGGGSNSQPGKYQLTVATMTTTLPLPGVSVGGDITISGDPNANWDETWQIVNALNSGAYLISQTSMSNTGVATYNWALAAGTTTAPVVGELVTVTGTTSNLNGSGVYNVTDAVIASVTGTSSGTFTITGFSQTNVETVVQSGAQAVTSGTQFQFDPGVLTFGNSDSPIYGNSGGGYVTLVGSSSVTVGVGTRKGTVFFITRNGYWSRPASPVQFDTSTNTNYILASNIPIGPENVIARAIVFTEAVQEGQPGASYYTIPTPVSFVNNGVTYQSSSLIIWDNVTTTAQFTFTDEVLLHATEVDIQDDDLFSLNEIGDAAWCTQYAGRTVWGRVNNKIQNFVNLSFDGGYNPNPLGNLLPLGWSLDATSNPSNSLPTLLISPIFGNSYYIKNQTGNVAASLGMITQTAYQDWENVNILQSNIPYSVRVTCRTPASTTTGNLVIDLTEFNTSTSYGATLGSFVLPCSEMDSSFKTFTGTLLTNDTTTIPSNLLLRLWAQNLPDMGDVEIDRFEIFPTLAPINLTGLTISYKDDPESFSGTTGGQDTKNINSQPANGAFTILNKLYVVKESSLGYLVETPDQEPSNWDQFKEVSNVCGACGINAYDVGEEWAIMACKNGLFGFNGGQPTPIQLEIPDIWQAINWAAGNTICVRNDVDNRRILISVPMTTPNEWCPDFPVNNNPTQPNVVLMLNYAGIGTIEELINAMSMHANIIGKIVVHDMKRKWSLWSIQTPYMNLCKRNELFSEMMFCNGIGSSKIYNLGSYQSGADDNTPFYSSYCTYPFVDQEKAKEVPIFGPFNKRYVLYDALLSGNGTANVTAYQNTLNDPYPQVTPYGITLYDPSFSNTQVPINAFGQRLFFEFKTYGVGNYFNLSRLSVVANQDYWQPIGSPVANG